MVPLVDTKDLLPNLEKDKIYRSENPAFIGECFDEVPYDFPPGKLYNHGEYGYINISGPWMFLERQVSGESKKYSKFHKIKMLILDTGMVCWVPMSDTELKLMKEVVDQPNKRSVV